MLCRECRPKAAAWLDARIRLLRDAVRAHAGVPGAEDACATAATYLDAYQEVRHRLVGSRLPEEET